MSDPLPAEAAEPGDSDEIAEFYDRHPYPPPASDLDSYAQMWADPVRRLVEHHRLWPSATYRDDHTILVAGCGTSQAAKHALRYPRARVVGIDVSEQSLEHTRQLADRYDLRRLELVRLPIEEVGSLELSADHIVCTGVLHHLADPVIGLAALASVLAPAGAMHLMVYAPYGRTGVYMIQEYCRLLGVDRSPAEVADLVASLRELPMAHPLGHLLRNTPDFRHDDAIADALLNPRDRSYSVPELFDWLEGAGLRFHRWLRQAAYDPSCGAPSQTPHGARMTALSPRDRYAAMELFRGTMTRHSLIAGHHDEHAVGQPDFSRRGGWPDFVPIVEPTVTLIEERLPPEAAAALVNRAHVETDIVCFLDADDRRRWHAIDGRRTAGEISADQPELFERLWRHDLVVFDTSRVSTVKQKETL